MGKPGARTCEVPNGTDQEATLHPTEVTSSLSFQRYDASFYLSHFIEFLSIDSVIALISRNMKKYELHIPCGSSKSVSEFYEMPYILYLLSLLNFVQNIQAINIYWDQPSSDSIKVSFEPEAAGNTIIVIRGCWSCSTSLYDTHICKTRPADLAMIIILNSLFTIISELKKFGVFLFSLEHYLGTVSCGIS